LETSLLWILVTGIGWSTSLFLGLIIVEAVSPVLSLEVNLILGSAISGALLGLFQWSFLRPQINRVSVWILASALGWIVGLAVAVLALRVTDTLVGAVVGGTAGGSLFGLAQHLALYPEPRRKARWVMKTAAGWGAALTLGTMLTGGSGLEPRHGPLMGVAFQWAIGGVVTGLLALVALTVLYPGRKVGEMGTSVKWLP
jgi:hypothetical protein